MGEALKRLNADSGGLIVTTPEQLRALVTDAVKAAIANANGTPTTAPEYLTIQDVSEWLDATPRTVRQWIETGGLPAMRIGAREWRLSRASVISWLESRSSKPGSHGAKHAERTKRAKGG